MRDLKAYRAMFHFLDERYKRLPSDALGGLLGELNLELWGDGEPGDPAISAEWERAVEKAEGELAAQDGQRPAFRKAS